MGHYEWQVEQLTFDGTFFSDVTARDVKLTSRNSDVMSGSTLKNAQGAVEKSLRIAELN